MITTAAVEYPSLSTPHARITAEYPSPSKPHPSIFQTTLRDLKAALAAIDTCDATIPGDDDILSVKSAVFRKLRNIVIAVNKLLANPTKF